MLDDTFDDNGAKFVWRRDFATIEWAEALGYVSRQLLSSRTNVRIPFLREDLLALVKHEGTCSRGITSSCIVSRCVDLSPSQVLDVFELSIQTYPRYADAASREAVQAIGKELVQRGETGEHRRVTEQIMSRIANEVGSIAKLSR